MPGFEGVEREDYDEREAGVKSRRAIEQTTRLALWLWCVLLLRSDLWQIHRAFSSIIFGSLFRPTPRSAALERAGFQISPDVNRHDGQGTASIFSRVRECPP